MAERETKPKKPKRQAGREQPEAAFAIVGIGVCLASLRSLQALFASLSVALPAAYVVAIRQQDGLTAETVMDAVSSQIDLPVRLAQDGERLVAGHVYVGGGNQVITISDGHLGVRHAAQAMESGGTVDSLLISLAENAKDRSVAVILTGLGSEGTAVEPLLDQDDVTALLVLFQDAGPMQAAAGPGRGGATDEHVERLENELRLTKDRQQATIEELESTNEELKSSNEEYQSINEELQTVNAELDVRVADLARANSDLRNLLESTQIATIFLDNDLRVRSFTPAATEIFHLLDTDVGRPLDHLGSRVSYNELSEDVRHVLTKLGTVQREVKSRDGCHYIARIHPYRSIDNCIAGAVLTFVDVTSTVKAETALRQSESELRTLLGELQHRVRNTLAVVKSIARRTADSSDSVEEMSAHLVGRLDAFARVQSAVARNPEAGVDLAMIVADELGAHAIHEGEQLTVEGPPLRLQPKAAGSISLAVHELATNAVKHGPFGRNGGKLAVNWRIDGGNGAGRHVHFEWAEDGHDGALHKPSRSGFGMKLLTRVLPYDLGAKTDVKFDKGGIRFRLELPIEHVRLEDDPARKS